MALMLHNVGTVLSAQWDYLAAQLALEQARAIRTRALRDNHPLAAETLRGFGQVMLARGDQRKAIDCLQRALAIYNLRYGGSHLWTSEVAICLRSLGESSGFLGSSRTQRHS
jgi:tetratricopeptide (TPR) repeat protein